MATHRAALQHHGIEHLTKPWDVILQTRPDVIFSSAVSASSMAYFLRKFSTPALLLLRHGSGEHLGGMDPMEIAWFASRSAIDRICPDGSGCFSAAVQPLRHHVWQQRPSTRRGDAFDCTARW